VKPLSTLWERAQAQVQASGRRAEAEVFGQARARELVQVMQPDELDGMREVVTQEMGARAWRDFQRVAGISRIDKP
jgi:hypothetical protein